MADETPSEREERLTHAEERLQKQHERVKEARSMPERTSSRSGNFGKFVGGMGSFFGEHRVVILAVIGFGIVFYLIMRSRNQNAAQTGVANQQGSLAGYQNAQTATALDQLTTAINNFLANQQGTPSTPTSNQNTPPQIGTLFKGPTGVEHYVANGNETLSQIAAKLGTGSWNSIYAIPNNQLLFGKMNSVDAAKYKPPAGTQITVPGSATLNTQANHSPMYSFLALSPHAVPGTDLSHSGTAFGPKQIMTTGRIHA